MGYTNLNSTTWGRVEFDTLEHDVPYYEWFKYYHVNGGNPDIALQHARLWVGKTI